LVLGSRASIRDRNRLRRKAVSDVPLGRLTPEEIAAECGTALPAKEVLSLLDLNANIDLLLDLAAPVDLAIGANANIAAPINAAVDANVLSSGSASQAGAFQTGAVHQGILGNATATSDQTSSIGQGTPGAADAGTTAPAGGASDVSSGSLTDGNLLNVNVNVNGNLHLASPINGAVAANANAAAPINAAVSANIGSVDSSSTALSEQQVSIDQGIQGDATATGHQDSGISQSSTSADTSASTPAGAADGSATQPSGTADSSGTQPSG
jgi:hypothetical protein